MMMEISIRPMTIGDAAAVAGLYTALGYPATAAEMERRIARLAGQGNHIALVAAKPNGEVIACCQVFGRSVLEAEPWAELVGVVVAEPCRGQGVGSRLVAHAERWAREQGYGAMCLRANVVRTAAHRFYQRAGYAIAKSQHVLVKPLGGDGAGEGNRGPLCA